MGIKNLRNLIEKYSKNGIQEIDLNSFSGKIIAIDISIFIYRFTYNNDLINSILLMIKKFLKLNIYPLFIFDGKPPKEKSNTIKERQINKSKLESKKIDLENKQIEIKNQDIDKKEIKLNDIDREIKNIEKNIIKINKDDIRKLKEIFNALGLYYINAKGESDKLCSQLAKENIVAACLSEDLDFLVHGSNILLRNFNLYHNKINQYSFNNILNDFALNINEFIDLCILCGCDYTEKIKGIGIETAYKLIKEHKNIEEIIKNNKKFKIGNEFDYISARNKFKDGDYSLDELNEIKNNIKFNEFNKDILKNYLNENIINEFENLLKK